MATITTDKRTGIHRIQFTTKDGKRQTIQAGKIPKTEAREIGKHIDHLIRCSKTTEEPKEQTAKWVADVRQQWPRIANKLNELRLIGNGARIDEVFVEFCNRFILSRKDVKPATIRVWNQTVDQLRAFFGNRSLKELTKADGMAFLRYMKTDKESGGGGLGQASTGKYMGFTKQFLNEAVDSEIIPANPFSKVKTPRKTNKSRQRFIDRATIDAVIEMAPDAEMKLIIALSRYGGLRTPSEPFALRWQDIDWKRQRITVTSPKTEHHEGHESREIPLFPELLERLLEVQERAETGEEFVIAKRRQTTDANLRRRLAHIVRKAGFIPWPKITHNLRASRQTELEDQFPSHVVCQWMGNSQEVARDHYLQTLDSHFDSALISCVQKPTQHSQEQAQNDAKPAKSEREVHPVKSGSVSAFSQGFASVVGGLTRVPTGVEGNRTLPATFQPPQRV